MRKTLLESVLSVTALLMLPTLAARERDAQRRLEPARVGSFL
jgi:hypothetical protein